MGDRRHSRELALQLLFYLDISGENPEQGIESFYREHGDQIPDQVNPFFLDLVNGTLDAGEEIDALMETYSKNWKISRMSVVDRNIMRMATFELLKRPDIPPSVTINEAVEIGKKFGTRDSGPFINGILDRIRKALDR